MLRAAALALLVLISVAVMLPLVDSSAHNSGRSTASRRHHMGRRHSRAWWRRYRARMRRQRASLKRKETLQAARGQSLNAVAAESHNNLAAPAKLAVVSSAPKNPVNALSLPNGWSRRAVAGGETKFVVSAPDGQYVGAATLSLVNANAPGETLMTARANRRTLGGVPLAELRRTVIDKMVAANGWVVNDLQREIGGKPVFIVLAQTAASSDGRTPQLSWAFYFTEVEGRIYSLAASSLLEFSNRLADESAQFMASFHANSRSALTETSQR
ncbi:MAG: hypothetical protein QOJ02_4286 [Acidobacteriota bacterium]|jgi:hypothetical protein|nr:hypothetical protein [Acidobacteriota bacterium]